MAECSVYTEMQRMRRIVNCGNVGDDPVGLMYRELYGVIERCRSEHWGTCARCQAPEPASRASKKMGLWDWTMVALFTGYGLWMLYLAGKLDPLWKR